MANTASAPLDLRDLFAQPWEGEARLWRPAWLRLLPLPSAFEFRSEILNETPEAWDVLDTITFLDGAKRQRSMRCERLDSTRLKLSAVDMPGGAEIHLRHDGFDFTPYVIRTPVFGPLALPLRHLDTVTLEPGGTMLNTIELGFHGVRVGRITMRLRRVMTQRS